MTSFAFYCRFYIPLILWLSVSWLLLVTKPSEHLHLGGKLLFGNNFRGNHRPGLLFIFCNLRQNGRHPLSRNGDEVPLTEGTLHIIMHNSIKYISVLAAGLLLGVTSWQKHGINPENKFGYFLKNYLKESKDTTGRNRRTLLEKIISKIPYLKNW